MSKALAFKDVRKKPVVVKAVQFNLGEYTKGEWLALVPEANIGAVPTEDDREGLNSADIRWFIIPTLEGHHEATDGDYLMEGVEGEHYFCKPDIFAKSYEDA